MDRVLEEKISLYRFFTGMSAIAAGTKQSERCEILFGAAQLMIESTYHFRMDPFDYAELDRHIQIARDQLGTATFDMLSNEGRRMTIEQGIELATKTKND